MNHHRKGAVAAAMIAALVIMGLVVVGFVVMTASDADATIKRADAMRAFYTADSGINMSMREMLINTDCDGDGGIGSISNDNNSANDPSLGTASAGNAQVCVTLTTTGTGSNLSSAAHAGTSRRTIATNTEALAGGTRWMLYCDWPNAVPHVMKWNGRGWGLPEPTLDVGSMIYWSLLKRCIPRVELVAAASNNASEINVMIYNGTSWSNKLLVSPDGGDRDHRPFYIAYERVSGDALVVYRIGTSSNVYYRTWNGSAWSSEQTLGSPSTGAALFTKLVPKPGSNEIMLAVMDDQYQLFASVWNGSAWTDTNLLETSLPHMTSPNFDTECFDLAYESTTGRCMVAWGQAGNLNPRYNIWDGSSWLGTSSAPSVGGVPLWVRLGPNMTNSHLALAVGDDQNDVNVNIWSGSAWGSDVELATSLSTLTSRALDIAWEPGGGRALCVYSNGGLWTPVYNIWNGTGWGAPQTAPSLGETPLLIQLEPSLLGSEILLSSVIYAGQSALTFLRWNGTAFANYTFLESNVSGPNPQEVFMLSDSPPGAVGASARINGWSEVAP